MSPSAAYDILTDVPFLWATQLFAMASAPQSHLYERRI